MFKVTPSAQAQVAEYFKDKELKPVRVFLNQGCGGAQLALAIDDKKDSDTAFEFGGISYIIDQDLLEKAQPLGMDFNETGFSISSSLKLESGCSSCGTSGSCCS